MENNEHKQPVIDIDYIDKLLSAYPDKQEAPAPSKSKAKSVEPEPVVASAEPEPAAPAREYPLKVLLLAAGICLLLGFFLGRLSLPSPEPNPETSEPFGTIVEIDPGTTGNPGIAEDYTAMSTEQLVNIAVRISELSSYGSPFIDTVLTPNRYRAIKLENPVLTELEQRPDAITALLAVNTRVSLAQHRYAANALIDYYSQYQSDGPDIDPGISVTPACQWLVGEDEHVAIYEYTGSPEVQFNYGTDGSDGWTELNFDGAIYRLEGHGGWQQSEANFWFRVELKDNVQDILSRNPQPRLGIQSLSAGTNSGSWVIIQRYSDGWFVYGYTASAEEISFSFRPDNADDDLHYVALTAFPSWESVITRVIAETVLQCEDLIYDLAAFNPEQDIAGYPLIHELLSREDGITYLLQAAAGERSSQLFSLPALRNRMTDTELTALKVLTGQSKYINAFPSKTPLLSGTATGVRVNSSDYYHVGQTPPSLQNIPLSEMNCWIEVSLSSGALTLYQNSWDLEATLPAGHTVGVWKLYDSNNQLIGWIVSGKLTESDMIWLQLVKDSTLLQKLDVDYRVPES